MVQITDTLFIDDDELHFTASGSSGPGGQHVNKVSTRMTLRFDVAGSPGLTSDQKERIMNRLSTRINKNGVLMVVSQQHRSQSANRELALERFVGLLREALSTTPPRKRTRVPLRAHRRRIDEKKHRGRIKKRRAGITRYDDPA